MNQKETLYYLHIIDLKDNEIEFVTSDYKNISKTIKRTSKYKLFERKVLTESEKISYVNKSRI